MTLPPGFFYFTGGLLVVFGSLRVVRLGLRKSRPTDDEALAARMRRQARNHVVGGVAWVVGGVILILSGAGVLGR